MVPLLNPTMVTGLAVPAEVHDPPSTRYSYPVMGLPPSSAGAENATVALPSPGVADVTTGAPGSPFNAANFRFPLLPS